MNNLQMREVPNGCITIDAQPCRSGNMRERQFRFANIPHYDGESPKTHVLAMITFNQKESKPKNINTPSTLISKWKSKRCVK